MTVCDLLVDYTAPPTKKQLVSFSVFVHKVSAIMRGLKKAKFREEGRKVHK